MSVTGYIYPFDYAVSIVHNLLKMKNSISIFMGIILN